MNPRIPALLALAATFLCTLNAEVTPGSFFTDNAVLQRGKPVAIFGTAAPGEKVTVSFKGQSAETLTADNGKWLLLLESMPADAQGAALSIKGKDNAVEFKNVVVGDVWLCGGQSNMTWPVRSALNPQADIDASANPLIRHIKAELTPVDAPQDSVPVTPWQEASPETTANFTATGYFFARALQKEIGVPVGLLHISFGGTQVEAWMSEQAIRENPQHDDVQKRWQMTLDSYPARYKAYEQKLKQWESSGKRGRMPVKPEGPGTRTQPASLYNGMLHPALPYNIAGILWYQAEANSPRYHSYGELIRGMIRLWRADFKQGDLPFYYVELANNKRGTDKTGYQWAYTREMQREALKEPNTAYVTAIDIGESANAHFRNKQELGRRLALCALNQYYKKDIEYLGPQYAGAQFNGDKARVTFTHADGLYFDKGPDAFELAGEDQVFHPAHAKIDGASVIVSSPKVRNPVAVRYFFYTDPSGAVLRNKAGLPASPLRSDNWPEPAPAR